MGRPSRSKYGSSFYTVYREYQKNAGKSGHVFALTEDEFFTVVVGDCYYCGIPPSNFVRSWYRVNATPVFLCNGVDRVDNDKGYEITNVVPCCKTCNRAKSDLTLDEFKAWADRVVEHLKGTKL